VEQKFLRDLHKTQIQLTRMSFIYTTEALFPSHSFADIIFKIM